MYEDDEDDDGPETFSPAPHPDDRLWRHPSEIASMMAAQAAATAGDEPTDPGSMPTAELPTITVDAKQSDDGRFGVHRGLLAAAVLVIVGASALALGVASSNDSTSVTAAEPAATNVRNERSAVAQIEGIDDAALETAPEAQLAQRLHDQLAPALPRVQAATPYGMREGSGIFLTEDGLAVTSARLVADSDYLLAWTTDGGRWHAHVVAIDTFSDIAIIQVDTQAPSVAAPLRSGNDLRSGQYAMAIDHGAHTMQVGQVTSLVGADPATPGDDASRILIEPGARPGSAIVDDTGQVIAMVNLGGDDGVDRATPAWMLADVAVQLLDDGAASHAWLGVAVTPSGEHAVEIVDVVSGSPADAAKLRVGDIIDSVDAETISTSNSLWTLIQQRGPGDRVTLAVTRTGERRLLQVTLGSIGE